ncbi:alpha-D-ribose 1-methylphosphonate 5-triphosphate diphosphatase [Pseudonocardia sichuanensis]
MTATATTATATRGSSIHDVTLVPGGGRDPIAGATVDLDADGTVVAIRDGDPARSDGRFLVPAAVDLHLDNLAERRRPRATVRLDQAAVIAVLDAECAAAGIGTVCIAARCEDAPGKGVVVEDAVELARVLEDLAPHLACDWRIHARVEVTDDRALGALASILEISSRVAIISVMEHSAERSRFASREEHRAFYAADWGVSLDEVDRILEAKAAGGTERESRRAEVARLSRAAGIVLASHDDRSPSDVDAAHALGATVAEFPLTIDAALHARRRGMATVLGAPNAIRGRSTSPGNVLVADAVAAGACDVLCCDYLPFALQAAPHALARAGVVGLGNAVDLVSTAPAAALGLPSPAIEVGRPLTAALGTVSGTTFIGTGLWRAGRRTFRRDSGAPTARERTPMTA